MANTRLAGLALWLGVLIAGCTRQHPEAGGDSSTHWLKSCGRDDQCGGLSCVCGLCSTECGASEQCDAFGSAATCVASGAAKSCGKDVRICDHECSDDPDCADSRQVCVLGRCRGRELLGMPFEPEDGEVMSTTDAAGSVAPTLSDAGAGPSLEAGSPGMLPAADAGAGTGTGSACAPQRAQSAAKDCLASKGFAWNGTACEEVVCDCVGEECGSIYPTTAACDAAYLECISPMSVCSGLPWYQCVDHCPGDWNLAGGGRSFGECSGDCSFELTISPPRAPSGGSCSGSLSAELLVKNTEGQPDRLVFFDLAPAAFEQAMRLSRALAGLALEPVTGCPDCADGGRAWIKRQIAESTSSEEFAYDYYKAPPVLRGVDQFVQRLINEANVCRGALLSSCFTSRGSGSDVFEPICGRGTVPPTSCVCPVAFEALSTLEGTECTGTCTSCQVPGSTCGANCVQPCAGGAPKWDVYCTE